MSNGETVKEIKSLLSEPGAIKPTTAQRLTLELMTQLYDKMERYEGNQKVLLDRVDSLEKKSIIIWIENNPKLFTFLISVYLLLTQVVDLKSIVSKALGI